jgi:hydroxyethylthiazole kinase
MILEKIKPNVIRGNISEIKTLALGSGTTKGVDADAADTVTEGNLDQMVAFAKGFAAKTGAVIAITGAIDLVADAETCYVIRNGRPEMSRITGTGCQLSGIVTAYAIANPDHMTEAVAAAVCVMGLAGEIGVANMTPGEGNSSLRNRIIDAIYNMDAETLNRGAKYEVR